MSTRPTTLSGNGAPVFEVRRRRWIPRLRDAKIRSKLALILIVPLAAVILLATIRLVSITQGAVDATTARSLTALALDVSALAQEVHKERMAAANLLAGGPSAKADTYNQQVRRTDERISAYQAQRQRLGEVPTAVQNRLRIMDDRLATLNSTRQELLDRTQMPVAEAVLRYGVILTDLVAYADLLGQLPGEGAVADSRRALAAFARAKAATAEEEAVVFAALTAGQVDDEQFSSFVATLTSQQEALLAFALTATPEQQKLVDGTVTGDAALLVDRVVADVTRSVGGRSLISATDAANAIGAVADLMRWTEIQLGNQLLAQADQVRADVVQQAIVESTLVVTTLLIAIALAVMLARSLNQSLRRLREGALSVANHDLPAAVNRLRDANALDEGGVEEIVRQVRDPIRLTNRDEVGQVAAAFNVVHREAVRVAAEQAALRTSVSAMFLSLARRSQTLVDRMIGELDMIERGEEDPKRLAQLFELDHLATRMRRNDENLLVLAGADSTAPRRDDALLVDALRAAQSEVENYNRIEFGTVDPDISVAAHAVNDVVRLVAELLDNATRFSSPKTTVIAEARRIRDYVVVQVEDRGLGLSEEQLEALNRRLAQPADVDVSSFRLMGLAVVSRLASRYDISVELRPNVEGGTIAQVTLPSSIVILPRSRGGRDQALNRQRQPLAVESGPSAPAQATQSWSQPAAPAAPARSAATLPDQWRTTTPGQWSTSNEPQETPVGANASLAGPSPAAPVSQPSPAQPAAPQVSVFQPMNRQPTPNAPGYQPQQPAAPQVSAFQPMNQQPTAPQVMPQSGLAGADNSGSPTMAYPTLGALSQRTPNSGVPGTGATMGPASLSGGLPAGPVAGPSPAARPAPAVMPPAPPPVMPTAPRPEESGEAPIFREMEAVWFRSHGQDATAIFTLPTAGFPPQTAPPAAEPARTVVEPAGVARAGGLADASARTVLPTRVPTGAPPPAPYTPPPAAAPQPPAAAPQPPAAAPQPPAAAPQPPAAAPQAYPAAPTSSWRTAADEGWARASRAAEPAAGGTTRSGLPKRVPQAQLVPGGVENKSSRDRTRRSPDEVRGLLSAYHRGVQRGRSAGSEQQHGTTSTKETSG